MFLVCIIIEEYLRSISAVDSILNLDRMRQSVHLREEQMKNRPKTVMNKSFQQQNGVSSANGGVGGFMRKTLSVPNISQLFIGSSPSVNNLSNLKLSQLPNGSPAGSNSAGSPAGQGLFSGDGNAGGNGISSLGGMRRTRPIRSESLANLSGFTSPPGASPSQQSPQTPRPSSLSLGKYLLIA
jgi:hypothetical protein